jgi:hypothetical protein
MIINRELRDMFVDKKSIHIKLPPDVHSHIRTRLFNFNLTMQDMFEGFARLVAKDDKRAIRLLEHFTKEKIEDSLLKVDKKQKNEKTSEKKIYFSELEEEAMYNLIKETSEDDETENEDT